MTDRLRRGPTWDPTWAPSGTALRRMYASDLSAMPADLEQQVDLRQMADLLALLSGARR